MKLMALVRPALAGCLLLVGAEASAAVTVDFSGTTHADFPGTTHPGSTSYPVSIPITATLSFDPTQTQTIYSSSAFAGYSAPGTAQFTVDGQTYSYSLTDLWIYDSGEVVFDLMNGSNALYLVEFTSSTDISGFPTASVLTGPTMFLTADISVNDVPERLSAEVRALPEPATWAMMLLGFAGIGFSMRRKRTPVLATA